MPDTKEGFETEDNQGSTGTYKSSVTTAIAIPSSPDKLISEFHIQNTSSGLYRVLEVSLDGGSTYNKTIGRGGNWIWTVKGDVRQIYLRSLTGNSVDYEAALNFEVY